MKNAVVGQSGGPTAAINATLAGVIRGCAKAHRAGEIRRLYGMRNGIEGLLADRMTDLTDLFEAEERLSLLEKTPSSALGSCRRKLPQDPADREYDRLFEVLARHEIGYFFYIGGNDSMDSTAKLSRAAEERGYDLRVIGVPKTIDNDLCGTDHTPGFGSAAKYIATTTSEILLDCACYTVPAVTVIEIMGRDAGWLTAAAGLSAGNGRAPDYIYLPETAFSTERFLADIKDALKRHPDVVVAISEGIRDDGGNYVGSSAQSGAVDTFGHKYLAGAGKYLEHLIRSEIGCKVRSIELNLPQRCAGHLLSASDVRESVAAGEAAVDAAVSGQTGVMMAFLRADAEPYAVTVTAVPVSGVANAVRRVPRSFINKEGNGLTDECLRYLLPLIEGEVSVPYENGLPVHFTF